TDIYEGTYVISETVAPSGYILNESPKSVNVSGGKLVSVEFLNKPLSGIAIVKLDAVTHKPLQGAAFTVTKANGERIGTFKTEADGKIIISDLDEGVYVVGEITAPDGYAIDETPKNVTVKSDELATVEFNDKPYSGIQINKIDAVTNAPLAGATFVVEHANGEKVGTYKTDAAGKIIVPDLPEGAYIVSETIAPSGYVKSVDTVGLPIAIDIHSRIHID
ncbi:MAG: SpaA isopeptide-forming pilin-related protein, partial [Oscillospiraceae bacterium]|nr:SpaA isopeptide-forming pilin-related protein [Oscillospiraceae bacterium]